MEQEVNNKKRVVVVGAGPCGLLLANYLIRRRNNTSPFANYQVNVYERRPDFRSKTSSSSTGTTATGTDSRTFPLVILSRGEKALRQVPGLWEAIEKEGVTVDGICLHRPQSANKNNQREQQPVTHIPRPPNLSIDRNTLAKVLMDELEKEMHHNNQESSSSASFISFDSTISHVDFVNKTCTVLVNDPAGAGAGAGTVGKTEQTVPYDYLVVCDGARSSIRQLLSDQGKLSYTEKQLHESYKTLFLPTKTTTTSALSTTTSSVTLERGKIHSWMSGGDYRILGVPLAENSFHGVFIFPKGKDPFQNVTNSGQVVEFFESLGFSDIAALLASSSSSSQQEDHDEKKNEEEVTAFMQRPASSLVSITTDTLHVYDDDNNNNTTSSSSSSILLLGDAAHAVSASLGQGCNAALEDVQLFCECLGQQDGNMDDDVHTSHADNWNQALPLFTSQRLLDVHAVVEMSHYSTPRTSWMRMEFLVRLLLKRYLPSFLTRYFMGKLPMEAIADTNNLSYTQALEECRWWIDRVKKSAAAEEGKEE